MAGQHHDLAAVDPALQTLDGLGLEVGVARADPLVQQQDILLDRCRYGESQAHLLAGRERVQPLVDLVGHIGKFEDVVDVLADVRSCQAHRRATQENVLAHGGLGAEPQRQIHQGLRAPLDRQAPGRGRISTVEHFQQGGFAGAVLTQQRHALAFTDGEIEVFEQRYRPPPGRIEHGPEKYRPPAARHAVALQVRGDGQRQLFGLDAYFHACLTTRWAPVARNAGTGKPPAQR